MKTLFLLLLLLINNASHAASLVNPQPCSITSVTTGGTAVNPITKPINGGLIINFANAAQSLYVDQTGNSSTTNQSATNFPLVAGQPYYVIPNSNYGVSVNSSDSNHPFFCVMW